MEPIGMRYSDYFFVTRNRRRLYKQMIENGMKGEKRKDSAFRARKRWRREHGR